MAAGLQCWDANGGVVFDSTNSRIMRYVEKISLPDGGWYRNANDVIWHYDLSYLNPLRYLTIEPYMLVKYGRIQYYNAYDATSARPGNRTAALFRFS